MIFATADPTTSNPVYLYVLLAAAVIAIIAGATPQLLKIFGSVGEAWQERMDRQRSAAVEADDADITELKRSLHNMSTMLDEERRLNAKHRVLIAELYRYILAAQMNPSNLQNQVPDPFVHLGSNALTNPSE